MQLAVLQGAEPKPSAPALPDLFRSDAETMAAIATRLDGIVDDLNGAAAQLATGRATLALENALDHLRHGARLVASSSDMLAEIASRAAPLLPT